ncbi:MAG: imidazolonepropionase [Gammaproteobacteria bacterium]|nr:imidazolonepropionase [Gammaproteobacteria bacterium]
MGTWDLLLTDARIATLCATGAPYGIIEDAALAVSDGRIAWLGKQEDLPQSGAAETRSLLGSWITPGLIDCHTHLVFGGNRAGEYELRLNGASYEDIARSGGGIMSTVNATRALSRDELADYSAMRLLDLKFEGVTTVEIKSGYGLDLETEIRMLEVARMLADEYGISVSGTFLGAHAVPAEYEGRTDDYVAFVCDEVLPAVAEKKLADAVDAYCERIAFSAEQVARVFDKAAALSLPVKLHADQLSDSAAAALAASYRALSADHLEYTSEEGVAALADSGTVAVMLPGAFITLGETRLPPVESLRDKGVPMAVATDCNPGTSPVCSLLAAMSLATSQFRMTPEECLAGVTRCAAQALGLAHDRGTLEVGKRADLAIWDIGHPRELSYWIGHDDLEDLLVEGLSVIC